MVSVTMRQQGPGNSGGSEHVCAVVAGGNYRSRNNRMLLRRPLVLVQLLLLLLVRPLFLSPASRKATFKTTQAGVTTHATRPKLQIQFKCGCTNTWLALGKQKVRKKIEAVFHFRWIYAEQLEHGPINIPLGIKSNTQWTNGWRNKCANSLR